MYTEISQNITKSLSGLKDERLSQKNIWRKRHRRHFLKKITRKNVKLKPNMGYVNFKERNRKKKTAILIYITHKIFNHCLSLILNCNITKTFMWIWPCFFNICVVLFFEPGLFCNSVLASQVLGLWVWSTTYSVTTVSIDFLRMHFN